METASGEELSSLSLPFPSLFLPFSLITILSLSLPLRIPNLFVFTIQHFLYLPHSYFRDRVRVLLLFNNIFPFCQQLNSSIPKYGERKRILVSHSPINISIYESIYLMLTILFPSALVIYMIEKRVGADAFRKVFIPLRYDRISNDNLRSVCLFFSI